MPSALLELRPAVLEDAPLAADLETAITPDDPRDPDMMTFWWGHPFGNERIVRWIAVDGGAARAFVAAGHNPWQAGEPRFGWVRVRIHPDEWAEDRYLDGLRRGEAWLREEAAEIGVQRVREDATAELETLQRHGYREERRNRVSRLDLVRHRDRLLASASAAHAEMDRQGVRMLPLTADTDPDKLQKLYALDLEATEDVPKSVPWPVPTFDEWSALFFEHPGHRADRIWIAREGDRIVGLSFMGYPPKRGTPWTSFTATARSVRGRGIARALKYQTVAQAIELGATRVETHNDAANAPILHLNMEMGYEPAPAIIELHSKLG